MPALVCGHRGPEPRRRRWRGAYVWAALAGAGCSAPTEPPPPTLEPGRYVLSTIDGTSAPFVLTRLEREGQATVLATISYDTVTVIDDSTARHHVRHATLEQLGTAAPVEVASEEINVVKRMLHRDDEIVLVGAFGEGPTYLVARDGGLVQRVRLLHGRCPAAGACSTLSSRIVDARYVHR